MRDAFRFMLSLLLYGSLAALAIFYAWTGHPVTGLLMAGLFTCIRITWK